MVAPAPFGGLESVLRSIAQGHGRLGHRVRVAIVIPPRDSDHPFATALASDGVPIARISVGNRDYAGERAAVRRLVRSERPDIVHTHGFRPDVVDGGVARGEGIPVVSTCHGFIDSNLRGRLYQWLQRRSLRHFDAVIAVSGPIAERVRAAGVPAAKVHVVANVFASAAPPIPRDEAKRRLDLPAGPVIGWVGRLSVEKGPDIALEAFARLRQPDASRHAAARPRTDARLVMIGGGPDEASLRRRAVELGIDDAVLWRGIVPDAGALHRAFDAFLLSSRTEGTPIALLEAIAAGVPVVATRVGGVPDVIDESSGTLVKSGDVAGLAAGLAHTLDDSNAAKTRAERARAKLAGSGAAEKWLARYESIYRSVIDKRRGEISS